MQLSWIVGSFHFKLADRIVAPTDDSDPDDRVNLGRK